MKKHILILLIALGAMGAKAQVTTTDTTQAGDAIVGVWQTEDQKAQITITREGTVYQGKLSNAALNIDKKLVLKLPTSLLGIYILRDFTFAGDNRWNGTIYDPKSKNTYECYLKMEGDGRMKVRGYKGISLFGKSQYWTRLR